LESGGVFSLCSIQRVCDPARITYSRVSENPPTMSWSLKVRRADRALRWPRASNPSRRWRICCLASEERSGQATLADRLGLAGEPPPHRQRAFRLSEGRARTTLPEVGDCDHFLVRAPAPDRDSDRRVHQAGYGRAGDCRVTCGPARQNRKGPPPQRPLADENWFVMKCPCRQEQFIVFHRFCGFRGTTVDHLVLIAGSARPT
jgi:hypothetical protein